METQALVTPRHATGKLLRLALKADAAVTGANAVVYIAAAPLLDGPLGVPAGLLVGVGAFLAVFAGLVYRLATRPAMPRAAVVAVIAANAVWAIESFVLLALDAFSPSTLGQIVIAVQAIGVAALATLQYEGLRRS